MSPWFLKNINTSGGWNWSLSRHPTFRSLTWTCLACIEHVPFRVIFGASRMWCLLLLTNTAVVCWWNIWEWQLFGSHCICVLVLEWPVDEMYLIYHLLYRDDFLTTDVNSVSSNIQHYVNIEWLFILLFFIFELKFSIFVCGIGFFFQYIFICLCNLLWTCTGNFYDAWWCCFMCWF